ncbi:hypothetical protein FH972_025236 [Carpinus fangiana]|uniref:Uncharacterized protein n=1 Tax=Carpinus fangiana TaxID=176857 RepID=A0A5N6L0T3_9ROSI|nr:hypothetical protein FH972_025236 [Carpinus fangiana]
MATTTLCLPAQVLRDSPSPFSLPGHTAASMPPFRKSGYFYAFAAPRDEDLSPVLTLDETVSQLSRQLSNQSLSASKPSYSIPLFRTVNYRGSDAGSADEDISPLEPSPSPSPSISLSSSCSSSSSWVHVTDNLAAEPTSSQKLRTAPPFRTQDARITSSHLSSSRRTTTDHLAHSRLQGRRGAVVAVSSASSSRSGSPPHASRRSSEEIAARASESRRTILPAFSEQFFRHARSAETLNILPSTDGSHDADADDMAVDSTDDDDAAAAVGCHAVHVRRRKGVSKRKVVGSVCGPRRAT